MKSSSLFHQVRSQEFAMGDGGFLVVWGRSPQPSEANGGLGAKPQSLEAGGQGAGGTGVWGRSPQRSKILHFLQK